MKKILICGATGFIGRNLLEYYSNKNEYKVRATHFKRPKIDEYKNVEWVNVDLRNPETVKDVLKDIDIVLQFAATTSGSKDILSKDDYSDIISRNWYIDTLKKCMSNFNIKSNSKVNYLRDKFYMMIHSSYINCKIELIENYKCDNKKELNKREEFYINKLKDKLIETKAILDLEYDENEKEKENEDNK